MGVGRTKRGALCANYALVCAVAAEILTREDRMAAFLQLHCVLFQRHLLGELYGDDVNNHFKN